MIADVAFDAPVDHPFSYRIPSGWTLSAGQRVLAPLGGARRVGIVLAVREGDEAGLKPLLSFDSFVSSMFGQSSEVPTLTGTDSTSA